MNRSFLLIILLALMFTSTYAQDRGSRVANLSDTVNELVHNYFEDLPREDKREVRRLLRKAENVFFLNNIRPPVRTAFVCDSSRLVELNTGREIYDLGFSSSCRDALPFANQGNPFCAGSKLIALDGEVIVDLGFNSSCQEAQNFIAKTGSEVFCSGSKLTSTTRGEIVDFGFKSSCLEAQNYIARTGSEVFCNGSKLYNIYGEFLRDFGFSSSCKEAINFE